MKIQKNRAVVSLILALASLFLWSSCTKEPLDAQAPGQYDGQGVDMTLHFTVPGDFAPSTRLTNAQETDIKDLLLFAFKGGVLSYVLSVDAVNNTPGNQKSFTATLKASDNASDTYKLMILANSHRVRTMLGADLKALNGKTYDQIQEQLNSLLDISKGIPMWGETSYIEINSSKAIPSIGLLRGVARIDIGVNAAGFDANGLAIAYQGLADFTLVRIGFRKYDTWLNYMPLPANVVGLGGSVSVTAPSLVPNHKPNYTSVQVTPNVPNGFVGDLYVAEHDVMQGETKPGGAFHESRSAIVVEGHYKNTAGFYRLDFVDKAGNLIDILRNHIYQFNITKVSGVGFPTIEEAYASASINMSAEVVAWDTQNRSDVVFDGSNYLSIDKREVRVNADGFAVPMDYDNPSFVTITVKSNAGGRITFPGYTVMNNDSTLFEYNLRGGRGKCEINVRGTDNGPGKESVYTIVFMFDMLNYDHPGYTFPTVLAIGNMRMPLDVVMENRKKYLDITPALLDDFAVSGGGVVEFNLVSDTDWTASITGTSNSKATVTASGKGTRPDKPSKFVVTFEALDPSILNVGGYVDITISSMVGLTKTLRVHQQKHVVWSEGYITHKGTGNDAQLAIATDRNDGGVFFKPGSVIAISSGSDTQNYQMGGQVFQDAQFGPSVVFFNPSNTPADQWYFWNYIGSVNMEVTPVRITPESGYHSLGNILEGKGDACRLVGLTIAEIKGGRIDNNTWRLPTRNEAVTHFDTGPDVVTGIPWNYGGTIKSKVTGVDYHFNAPGIRRGDSGWVHNNAGNGYIQTSTPAIEVGPQYTTGMCGLYIMESQKYPNNVNIWQALLSTPEAHPIRCVRQ